MQRALLQAVDRRHVHVQDEPDDEATVEVGAVTESELIDLAREMELPTPSAEPDLREEVERLRRITQEIGGSGRRLAAALGGSAVATVLVGAVLLYIGITAIGSAAIGVGLIAGMVSAVLFQKAASPTVDDSELRAAEARMLLADQLAADARERKERAAAAYRSTRS